MIIDAHAHLLQASNFDRETWQELKMPFPEDTPVEEFVGWLADAKVDKAIVMGQDMTRIWHSSCGEEHILDATKLYPDRLIGFASVEPIDSHNRLNVLGLEYFEKAVGEKGFKGLLLTPPYGQYYSNDRRVYPFYELAQKIGVVVQFHHSAQLGPPILAPHKYANLDLLNDVLIDFPNLRINIEHLGYPWYEQLFILMASDPNVYADMAMLYDRPLLLTWNLEIAKEYGVINRIMYGSDYWVAGQGVFSDRPGQDMIRWINLIKDGLNRIARKAGWPLFSSKEIEGLLGENAGRFYHL